MQRRKQKVHDIIRHQCECALSISFARNEKSPSIFRHCAQQRRVLLRQKSYAKLWQLTGKVSKRTIKEAKSLQSEEKPNHLRANCTIQKFRRQKHFSCLSNKHTAILRMTETQIALTAHWLWMWYKTVSPKRDLPMATHA